jgi:hypothetical protein
LIVTDGPAGEADAFDHVGIERALREEVRAADLLRLLLEHVDEQLADELALPRVGDAGEPAQEQVSTHRRGPAGCCNGRGTAHDLLASPMPHQAVIDEDAGQLVADRLVDQHRGDRRIDPAGQAADHRPLPTCARISAILVARNSAMVQSPLQPQTWRTKLAISLRHRACAPLRGGTGAVEAARLVGDHGEGRAVAGGDDAEAGGKLGHLVAVAHPHLMPLADIPQAIEQYARLGDGEEGAAEFSALSRLMAGAHLATQLVRHHLLAVADAI